MPPVVLEVTLRIDRAQINALQKELSGAIKAGMKTGSVDLSKSFNTASLSRQIARAIREGLRDGVANGLPTPFLQSVRGELRSAVRTGFSGAFTAGMMKGVDLAPLTSAVQKAVAAGIKAAIKTSGAVNVTVTGTGTGRAGRGVAPSTAASRAAANTTVRAQAQADATRLKSQARADATTQQAAARAQAIQVAAQARAAADAARQAARVNGINAEAAARAAAAQTVAQARANAAAAAQQARAAARANQPPSLATQSWRTSQAIQFGGGIISSLGAPRLGSAIGNVGNFVEAFGPMMGVAASAIAGFAVATVQAFAEIVRAGIQSRAELESAYSRIAGLTGLNAQEVVNVGQRVEGVSAGPTSATTQQLADAVYNIASTGFSGTRTGQILESANLASLAGLGDIGDTAGLIGKVLTTYGEQNISAARATDILTAAVRDGAAEGADFTAQIGKLLPFAEELGINFDEVAASLSAVSIITRDSAVASTQLQNAYSKLLSPTNEGLTVLDQIYGEGRGAQGVQESIRTQGFLQTLRDIYTAAEGNKQVLGDLFGDIRGLSAVLTLANDDFSKFETTLGNVKNSFGQTGDAAGEFINDTNTLLVGLGNEWDRFVRMIAAPLENPFKFLISEATLFLRILNTGTNSQNFPMLNQNVAGLGVIPDEYRIVPQLTPEQIEGFGGSAGLEQMRDAITARGGDVNEAIQQARAYELQQRTQTSVADFSRFRREEAERQYQLQQKAELEQEGAPKVFAAANIAAITDLAGQGADLQEGAIEKRAEANRQLAQQLGQSLDTAIESTYRYDQQFEKLDKAEAQLAKTPQNVTFGGLTARENKRLKTLETNLKIGEISNRIRERNIQTAQANLGAAKKELAVQNGVRRVDNAIDRDTIGDIRFQALQEEYAGLKGRAAQGTRGVTNPKYQAALDERDQAMQEINLGKYNLIQDKFIQVLGAASRDGKTFNNILDSGGDILQAFADNAGLFKTSGFTMQLAEAGFEAKYLRDSLTGAFLQGDDLEQGFANYSTAIENFTNAFADARKFIEGTEPIKMQTLIDFEIIDATTAKLATDTKEQQRIMGEAQKMFERTGDVRVLERAEMQISEARFDYGEAKTPEGFRKQLLAKYGLDEEVSIKSMVRFETLFSQENKNKLEAEAKQMETALQGIVTRLNEQLKNLGKFTFEDISENPAFREALPDLETLFGPGMRGVWDPSSTNPKKQLQIPVPAELRVELKTDNAKDDIDTGIKTLSDSFEKEQYEPKPEFEVDGSNTDTIQATSQISNAIETAVNEFSKKSYSVTVPVVVTTVLTQNVVGSGTVALPPGAVPGGTQIGPINTGTTAPDKPPTSGPTNGQVVNGRIWLNGRWEEYASGTARMKKGWAVVGERGPEIIYNDAPNAGVLNAAETRSVMDNIPTWGPSHEQYYLDQQNSMMNAPVLAPVDYNNTPAAMDQWDRQNPPAPPPFDLSTLPAAPAFGLGGEDYMNMSNYNALTSGMVPMSDTAKQSLYEYMFRGTDANGNPKTKTSLANIKGTKPDRNYWREAQMREMVKNNPMSMGMDIYGWSGYNPGARFYDRFDSRVGARYSVSNTNTTFNVDATGSTQPIRVQEAVERAVQKAMRQYGAYEGDVRRGMRARGAR